VRAVADATPPPAAGLIGSLRDAAATASALLRTRLELLGVEIETEATRLVLGLVWGFVALFLAGLAVVFGVLLLLIVFWESHRIVLVAGLAGAFALGALLAGLQVRRLVATRIRLFDGSLRELAADVERLRRRP
jgi:uncharacterized membrane protein YqjE